MDHRDDAFEAVLRTRPTTPSGLVALTSWVRKEAEWLRANGGSTLYPNDFCALSGTIDDATRGMSGLEPWSPPRENSADGPDPILAAIEAHRSALTDWLKAVAAADQIKGERPTARVQVGTGPDGEPVRTELEGGGFSVAWIPNGKTYPIYANSDVGIERNAPKVLKGSDREAWISERLVELEAEERRIAKRHARTKLGKLEAAREKASNLERECMWDLIWTKPTTNEGLAVLFRYCRERGSISDMVADAAWEDALEWTVERAACALAGLPQPTMSKQVAILCDVAESFDPTWRRPETSVSA